MLSPESSDGFASVRTILPEEKATRTPGGFFSFQIASHHVFKLTSEEKAGWIATEN